MQYFLAFCENKRNALEYATLEEGLGFAEGSLLAFTDAIKANCACVCYP